MKSIRWAGVALLLIAVPALAGTRPGAQAPIRGPRIQDTSTLIDVNNIAMFVTNVGSIAYDLPSQNSGLFFPKGSERTAVYAAGLWIGAKVGGETRVTVGEYSQEYSPGPMAAGGVAMPDASNFRVYKINRGDTEATNPDYASWPVSHGAPVGPDGKPQVLGDQTLWCVFNDGNVPGGEDVHSNDAGGTPPLGVEVQQTVFAFNRPGALGNTVFIKWKVINKGVNTLEDTYISFWSDPDLGGASDDLVGCDTTLSLGYVYNATNNDNQYGATPPAVGYDFFQGPIVPSEGDTAYVSGVPRPGFRNLPMTSFNKYINGTDPRQPSESYNYMQGLEPDGAPVINPVTGQPTKFFLSGDPVAGTGWLDADPADRRLMLSSGPFVMAPGDTQEVVAAMIVGQGQDRLTSITAMKFYDLSAQEAFDANFDLPNAPPAPVVTATPGDGSVLLCWGSESETAPSELGYFFEGYNVYQGASVAGPFKRIATYDVINGIGFIFDQDFDPETGVVVTKPVQFGSDSGVRKCITITNDAVRGEPLHNATPYYFGVTSYSYNPDAAVGKTLENAVNVITVVPQQATAGTVADSARVFPATYRRIDTGQDPTTDRVEVALVDPTRVTGARYRVVFHDAPEPFPTYGGEEVPVVWDLLRLNAAGQVDAVLLANQINKTGDDNYVVADGVQVKVIGAYRPQLVNVEYVNVNAAHRRALTSGVTGIGLGFFFDAVGYARDFFGSSLDPDDPEDALEFTSVDVEFNGFQHVGHPEFDQPADPAKQQRGYRYLRGGSPNYAFQDFATVPFQAWRTVGGVRTTQIDVCFVENNGSASQNGTWGPQDRAVDFGGREYLFLMATPYGDTPKAQYTAGTLLNISESVPGMYAGWLGLRTENEVVDNGDILSFTWAKPGTANDVFEFDTQAPVKDDPGVARAQDALKNIRVVPNPYYAHSTYEINQFNRVIKFTNLPAECTIRIFNLAGDLIRTIEKPFSESSIVSWDLQTENALPVAGGVYIYHVTAPRIGESVGRFAVFFEKERLNTF